MFDATNQNDLEIAMEFLRTGTHIEKDRSDRTGAYRGMSAARYRRVVETVAPCK